MAYQDNCVQNSGGAVSRRTLVAAMAAGAGAIALGGRDATAQTGPVRPRPPSPPRRAISARGAPTTYFYDPDVLAVDPSFDLRPTQHGDQAALYRRCCGPKGRPGTRRAAISCGATSPTTGRCDGWRTTATSACSARRPTTATATRSTSRAGSSPASISPGGSRATSIDGTATVMADNYNGKKLNSPNDVVPHPDGSYLVHRPALWRPALRGRARRAGRPEQRGRQTQSADRPAGRLRAGQARTADQLLPRRSRAARSTSS